MAIQPFPSALAGKFVGELQVTDTFKLPLTFQFSIQLEAKKSTNDSSDTSTSTSGADSTSTSTTTTQVATPPKFPVSPRQLPNFNYTYSILIDSPNQGAFGLPMSHSTFDEKSNTICIEDRTTLKLKFTATLKTPNTIEGVFEQGGHSFPLSLTRSLNMDDTTSALKRPQLPQPPFPYIVKNLTIPSYDSVMLSATLVLPKGDSKVPIVILFQGSGHHDRDETLFGHKPFAVIAHHLALNGIGSIRFDERGVAKSQGQFQDITIWSKALDGLYVAALVKQHSRCLNLVALGHSCGGLTILLSEYPQFINPSDKYSLFSKPVIDASTPSYQIRNESTDPHTILTKSKISSYVNKSKAIHPLYSKIIFLAAPMVSGAEILRSQRADILSKTGVPELIETNEFLVSFITKKCDLLVQQGKDLSKEFTDSNIAIFYQEFENLIEQQEFYDDEILEAIKASFSKNTFNACSSPFLKSFREFDPSLALKKVNVPVLLLNGKLDCQVLSSINIPAAKSSLKSSLLKVKEYPDCNHLFQKAKTGLTYEYSSISTTIEEFVLNDIASFLKT